MFRNSRIGLRDITDGSSQTLLVGERSRDVADATWVGVMPGIVVCPTPGWANPACAPFITRKLVHYFVTDSPTEEFVGRMADLSQVGRRPARP